MSCDRIPCLPNENDRQVSIPESEYNRLKQIEAAYLEMCNNKAHPVFGFY